MKEAKGTSLPLPTFYRKSMLNLEQIETFLSTVADKNAEVNPKLAEKFGKLCEEAFHKHFVERREDKEFTLYMSTAGKPLCQLQMAKAGAPKEPMKPWDVMKLLMGDLNEAAALVIMEAAGVPILATNTPVEFELEGEKIRGRIDVELDDGIWDVKSTTKYSFEHKFNKPDAFSKIREDDAFGYIPQGYLYEAGTDKKFCGWIVINRETGEWCLTPTPMASNSYRKEAISIASEAIRSIKNDHDFTRCFEPLDETFNKKSTGNKYLGISCVYCAYKETCWKSAGLTQAPQPASKAMFPRWFWYVGDFS